MSARIVRDQSNRVRAEPSCSSLSCEWIAFTTHPDGAVSSVLLQLDRAFARLRREGQTVTVDRVKPAASSVAAAPSPAPLYTSECPKQQSHLEASSVPERFRTSGPSMPVPIRTTHRVTRRGKRSPETV